MKKLISLACLCMFSLTVSARAQTLKIGDDAPKLAVAKFVQGEPVKEFEKGKVYVIECWATWCGPCIAAIPHVNELQKKYAEKGLVVIGQNVWERDEKLVEPFIKKMGEKMSYRIAMDDKSTEEKGAMAVTWMLAAGRNGIPCSFIVNQEGKIAWIGHPMRMDEPLAAIIDGKWDLAKAREDLAAESRVSNLQREASQLASQGKFDEALAKLDELEKASPAMAKATASLRFRLLLDAGKAEQAQAIADAALKDKDTATLTRMASMCVMGKSKNLELAEKLSDAAVESAKPTDYSVYVVRAQVHAAKEEWAKAVECQKKAIELAPEQAKQYFERTLKTYEEKAAK